MQRIAFIAIGTNLGDRGFKIRETLRKMSNIMSVESTSFLYESQPMYYRDQPEFLNAVCRVQTNASPRELLLQLKVIEKELGRENTFRNGPRAIDLDILLYEDCVMQSPELTIPHPSLDERPFVLKPLCDIDDALIHPVHGTTMRDLWKQLTIQKQQEVHRVIPCFNHCLQQTRYLRLDGQQAIIMGILNATPDSFSDGGQYSQSIDDIVAHARRLAHEGADIIDVGGESTRPGADEVSETDELARVIPAIEAIRAAGISCLISIDTRRSEVARRAILAGADIINDVSAARHDREMLSIVHELQVPFIAMHMRGDPQTMTSPLHSTYVNATEEIGSELASRLTLISQHIPRWLQIVDPGIGFAKGAMVNQEILKPANLSALKRRWGERPMVVGLSRKRFLSALAEPCSDNVTYDGKRSQRSSPAMPSISLDDRDCLTAGANMVALLGGADILRVHNVRQTRLTERAFERMYYDH